MAPSFQAGIPKTLGILSIIFGVLMFLGGFCIVGFMVAWPTISSLVQKGIKDTQAKVKAQQEAQLKDLDELQKAAKTVDEKTAIQRQKDDVIALTPKIASPNLGPMDSMMKNPTIRSFSLALYGPSRS